MMLLHYVRLHGWHVAAASLPAPSCPAAIDGVPTQGACRRRRPAAVVGGTQCVPGPHMRGCACGTHTTQGAWMRTPGVEPRSQAWEACMMPLHYVRL